MMTKHPKGKVLAAYDVKFVDGYQTTCVAVQHPTGPVGIFDVGAMAQEEFGERGFFTELGGGDLAEAQDMLYGWVEGANGGVVTPLDLEG